MSIYWDHVSRFTNLPLYLLAFFCQLPDSRNPLTTSHLVDLLLKKDVTVNLQYNSSVTEQANKSMNEL